MGVGVTSGETVRCSPWTRATNPDPCGTAGEYDTILAIEVPAPWPSDVAEFGGVWTRFETRVRALAVLPTVGDGTRRVTAWRRSSDGTFVGTDYSLPPTVDIETELFAISGAGPTTTAVTASPAPREILVCGHGQRDRCCGSLGVRLEAQLVGRFDGVRVRRCSHLGGHRFAPTAITFPDGRWWAYLDLELVDRIMGDDVDGEVLATHYRGRGGLNAPAQVVERELYAEHGAAWKQAALLSTASVTDQQGTAVNVVWQLAERTCETVAQVAAGRPAPQIACGSIGPQVTKVGSELSVGGLASRVL